MPGPVAAIAGASLGSAVIGGVSANKAAKAQAGSAGQQVALQREIFAEQKEMFRPYLEGGGKGFDAYQYELGIGEKPDDYGGYTKAPGYDFRLQQGQDAIQAGVGARHGLNSGATLKALQTHGQDYATSQYDSHLNRLAGVSQMGQASAAMTASAGDSYARGSSNALANLGNAQASGAIGVGNAIQGGINNGLGAWAYGKGNGLF